MDDGLTWLLSTPRASLLRSALHRPTRSTHDTPSGSNGTLAFPLSCLLDPVSPCLGHLIHLPVTRSCQPTTSRPRNPTLEPTTNASHDSSLPPRLSANRLHPRSSASVTRILHLSNFPKELKTRDILGAFSEWESEGGGYKVKWLDDTNALIVFESPVVGKFLFLLFDSREEGSWVVVALALFAIGVSALRRPSSLSRPVVPLPLF